MAFDLTALPSGEIFVGGTWQTGRGAEITSIFPADRSLNRVVKGASAEDVEQAINRALAAQTAWGATRAHERAAILHRISDGIAANADRISFIQTRDTGKTLTETKALALSAAGTFRYFAGVVETADEAATVPRADTLTLSLHEPIGLVSAITPWNSPIASDAQKVAPALAAGNAVLLKPASWSPLVSLEFARIADAAGLPKGLLSVLPGSGGVVGELLVTHPAIGRVSFTGGTSVGRGIARKAAEKLMPVSLELGGKSPTIVFSDADMEIAIAGILFGIFSSTGQSCIAGSRLYVERAIYEPFVERLVAATRNLVVGHPFDAATQVAPLVHDDHRRTVEEFVASGLADGGTVLTGGARPTGALYEAGVYYQPTIVAGLSADAHLAREEVFGPVLTVFPFDSEEEVIRLGNDNAYGLACGIWTRDTPKALRVGRRITAGTVWINTYKQFSIATPFGGMKESGVGREKGRAGLFAYMNQKSYYLDLTNQPHPWARLG